MNTAHLLEVADAIEAHPDHFDLADWSSDDTGADLTACGTTACIAG